MRALIRADLQPTNYFSSLWNKREKYNSQVTQLFLEMGFAPVKVGQKALLEDPFVQEIIEDMPPDIKEQETQHIIMLGYVGEGQSHFIVTGVNPSVIHIRIKGRLFGRLRRACVEIIKKSRQLRDKRQIRFLGGRLVFSKYKTTHEGNNDSVLPYLEIKPIIEVMEPMRDHPTILGEIIESAFVEVLRRNRYEVWLIGFTLIGTVALFFTSPPLAPILERFLLFFHITNYNALYIQNALERTFSAFLVSFAVTLLGVFVKIFEMSRLKPIKWDSDTENRRED